MGGSTHRDRVFLEVVNAATQAAATLDTTMVETFSGLEEALHVHKQAVESAMRARLKGLPCEVVIDGQPRENGTQEQADYCFMSGLVDIGDIMAQVKQGRTPGHSLLGVSAVSFVSEENVTHSALVDAFSDTASWVQAVGGRVEMMVGHTEWPLGRPVALHDRSPWMRGNGEEIPIINLAMAQTTHRFHRFDAHPLHLLHELWTRMISMAVLSPHELTPAVVAAMKGFNEAAGLVVLRPDAIGKRLERTTFPFIYTTAAQRHWTVTVRHEFVDELLDLQA